MESRDRFDAVTALGEVRRIEQDVRSRSRWQGWIWLLIAIITPIFLLGTVSYGGGRSFYIAIGFGLTALAAWFWESRQTVVGRTGGQLDRPLTMAYAGLVVLVTFLRIFVLDDTLSTAHVITALLPSVPPLIGAWKIFRQ